MSQLGTIIAEKKSNNLNAIRLGLALLVMISHAFPLSYGQAREAATEPLYCLSLHQENFGRVAVDMFFFISGMLVTASWLRSKSMQDYLMKRVLRIYPGYIVAMVFSGMVIWLLCPLFRANAGHGLSWLIMLVKDCVSLTDSSLNWNGVFAENPFPQTANGSLWTIPIEFSYYVLVLCLGLFCVFQYRWLISMATGLVYLDYLWLVFTGQDPLEINGRFTTYFLVGVNAWLWRDKISLRWLPALGCVVILLVACRIHPLFSALLPLAGGYLVLWLGFVPAWRWTQWTDHTDLSYGVYLYAFLVQQAVASFTPLRSPLPNLAIAIPVTVGLAWLSWHLVESRFLKFKSKGLKDRDPALPAVYA